MKKKQKNLKIDRFGLSGLTLFNQSYNSYTADVIINCEQESNEVVLLLTFLDLANKHFLVLALNLHPLKSTYCCLLGTHCDRIKYQQIADIELYGRL